MINIILAREVHNHNEEANSTSTLCDWYAWKNAALVCSGTGVAKEPLAVFITVIVSFYDWMDSFSAYHYHYHRDLLARDFTFYPDAFFLPVVTPERLNHFSFELWCFFKLCIWHYGVIAGFIFMLGYTINKGLKQARCLARRYSS